MPTAAAALALGLWLFFGYFAFHTILIDDEVDEAIPFFTGPAPSGIEGDETTQEMADDMNEAMTDADMPMVDEVDEPMPEMAAAETPQSDDGSTQEARPADDSAGEAQPADSTPEAQPTDEGAREVQLADEGAEEAQPVDEAQADETQAETAEPRIIVEAAGLFISRSHPTEGSARVLGDGSGQRFLRLEDFRTDNGPDLNVYLSAAPPDAPASAFDDDFVDLGDLKGNVGSQNYEIPVGLDFGRYSTVAIWCVRFGVVFGAADLSG